MQMVAYIFTYIWASDILTFVIASSANALKLAVEMTKKVCTSARRSGMFSTDGLKPRGSRRVVYVSDPSSVANRYLPDPVREEDLKRWIDAIAAAEIKETCNSGRFSVFRPSVRSSKKRVSSTKPRSADHAGITSGQNRW